MTGSERGIVEIFNNADDEAGPGVIRHIAFGTDDADACVKAVTEAGYKVLGIQ